MTTPDDPSIRHSSGRRSTLLLFMALAFTACGLGERTAERGANPPHVAFDQTEYSFARIEPGGTVEHEFPFANRGGMDLTIDNVRVGCDCTATVEAERFVRPGESGRIRVTCAMRDALGPQRRTATVYSNDPQQPFVVLALVGDVDAVATVEPSPLYLGRVRRGQRAIRGARVRSAAGEALALDLVASPDAPFTIDRGPGGGSDVARFDLVIKRDAPLGPINQQVRVLRRTGEVVLEVAVVGEVTAGDGTHADATTR